MKTNLMTLLIAVFAVFNLNAEQLMSIPVATLSHNGNVTQFYGSSALQDAHAAAVSGDVITLNNGIFNACTITKGITLRGACMGTTPDMEEQGMRSTIIQTDMRIQVPMNETNTLKIEDLCFYNYLYVDSVPHISFARVKTRQYLYASGNINNFDAVQCSFYSIHVYSNYATEYAFVNSAIAFTYNYAGYACLPSHCYADHCVIGYFTASSGNSNISVFSNCIFTYGSGNNSSYILPTGCSARNCVAVNSYMFQNCSAIECKTASLATLFDYENQSFYYGGFTMPLTEEAAETYLGTDGTQVGIYGGQMPYTMMPYNPIVTKCDIAGKTDENGKLNVRIEVKSVW